MSVTPKFEVRFAATEQELRAVQALRYKVFVQEFSAGGPMVDHAQGLEIDRFDPFCKHLMLLDLARGADVGAQIVGVYRLLDDAGAHSAGQFYSSDEYDLSPLLARGQRMAELGRSCVDAEYRGGPAMYHLWSALAQYVIAQDIEILFGVASFHGADPTVHSAALSLLHHGYLAPPELRVTAKAPMAAMNVIDAPDLDRKTAMVQMPALIKAYLRLGGCVGEGAHLDEAFNTTDVCLILDVARMSLKQRRIYAQERTS